MDVCLRSFAQIVFIAAALNEPAFVRVRNAISVYALCLAAISIVSYSHSITIGTPDEPYLAKSDGEGYFAEAMLLRDGNILDQLSASRTNDLGYQFILACAFRLFSPDLMIGLLINNSALLLTVILLARTTFILTGELKTGVFREFGVHIDVKIHFLRKCSAQGPVPDPWRRAAGLRIREVEDDAGKSNSSLRKHPRGGHDFARHAASHACPHTVGSCSLDGRR